MKTIRSTCIIRGSPRRSSLSSLTLWRVSWTRTKRRTTPTSLSVRSVGEHYLMGYDFVSIVDHVWHNILCVARLWETYSQTKILFGHQILFWYLFTSFISSSENSKKVNCCTKFFIQWTTGNHATRFASFTLRLLGFGMHCFLTSETHRIYLIIKNLFFRWPFFLTFMYLFVYVYRYITCFFVCCFIIYLLCKVHEKLL